ncbi:MAG: phospholipid carrier-dependent glycosyltransferase [Candidatus Promineifilaceae bacterium]
MITRRQVWLLTAGVLAAVVIVAFVLRYPLVIYNAPVSAHPDERGTLGLLWRLRTESVNPHFFAYPTFYFYLSSFWVRNMSMGQILPTARLLNLLLGCGLGLAAGGLAWQVTKSRVVLVLTTIFVLFSPELVYNASYLAVDALFVTLNVLALTLWLRFWASADNRIWIAAAIVSGLALGTKYNAVIVLIGMILIEWRQVGRKQQQTQPSRLAVYLPFRWRIGLLMGIACILGAASLLDPAQLVALMPNRASIEPQDVAFVAQWLTLFRLAAVGLLGVCGLIYSFPQQTKRFFFLRPYFALIVAALIFFAVTPFALVSWQEFLLDVGTELKKNALSGDTRYWFRYGGWLRQYESLLALAFTPIGVIVAFRRWPHAALFLASYLLLNYLAIGSATRGFERYLSPVLPILYLFAAIGVYWLAVYAAKYVVRPNWQGLVSILLLVFILIGVGVEWTPKLQQVLGRAGTTDYQHAGYTFIVERGLPDTVHFEGFVPMFELKVHGVQANWIVVEEDGWSETVGENDLLMVDAERRGKISAEIFPSLNLLWSSDDHLGLYIYEVIR